MILKLMNYDEFLSEFHSVSKIRPFSKEDILDIAKEGLTDALKGKKETVCFEVAVLDDRSKDVVEFCFIVEAAGETEEKEWNVRYLGML